MAESMEGRTAVNKKTGERVVFQNGRWQPLNEAETPAPTAPTDRARSLADQLRTLPQDMLRQGGLAARNVVTGLTGIPGMAADAAMAGYNLATGSQQQMPSGHPSRSHDGADRNAEREVDPHFLESRRRTGEVARGRLSGPTLQKRWPRLECGASR